MFSFRKSRISFEWSTLHILGIVSLLFINSVIRISREMDRLKKFTVYSASQKLAKLLIVLILAILLLFLFITYPRAQVEEKLLCGYYTTLTAYLKRLETNDSEHRTEELRGIEEFMKNHLRTLELERQELQDEISSYQQQLEQLKTSVQKDYPADSDVKNDTSRAKKSISEQQKFSCWRMLSCFDYSPCSLASGFLIYLYDAEQYFSAGQISVYLKTLIRYAANRNPHFTKNPRKACLYLVLIEESNRVDFAFLKSLPYWKGDGRNHLILYLSTKISPQSNFRFRSSAKTGKAIIAQSTWRIEQFRAFYDLIIPPFIKPSDEQTQVELPYMLPARRKYLLSFQGLVPSDVSGTKSSKPYNIRFILNTTRVASNDFFLDLECDGESLGRKVNVNEWKLCKNQTTRQSILRESTFTLIPRMIDEAFISTPAFLIRLTEAFKYGAIPVLLHTDYADLPFSEVIDWRKASLSIPLARISDCSFLLRNIPDNDVLLMRRQGRLLYDSYFSSSQIALNTILAVIRNRLNLPPPPILDVHWPSAYPDNSAILKTKVAPVKSEENVGPVQPPFNSFKFRRNFSIIQTQNHEMWNEWGDPFHLYPHSPFDPSLPSDTKLKGSDMGLHLNPNMGGVGKKFRDHLGGNFPEEQFTIVMMTYKREKLLMESLSRLHGLPYLNKVVVVWNTPYPPSHELRWPNISVPIHVLAAQKNSLNNHFLPFDVIETEAVLTLDDDLTFTHEEFVFGFRIWREERDRLVGFPSRYHFLDSKYDGWKYGAEDSCEYSMVLAGATFVHKYYLYMYSYYMSQRIRAQVDDYMNCEDIALNFLVSHISRKPPIKVTSHLNFEGVVNAGALHSDPYHYIERDNCLNIFSKIFGYTPLLLSQFRADSVLYNTVQKKSENKCYKAV